MIQSSKYPHPDSQTNEQRIASQKAQFIALAEELKQRDDEQCRSTVMTLLPWIIENDWEYPIQAMNSQLQALDAHEYAADVAAMRRGE